MKTLAIISEFNPFHNGHEYLLKKSKELTSANLSISLMSGDYVQRGERAIIDKFSRADSAMKAGFDMVIEMPVHISLQSAEYFAQGSINILDKLNIDYLSFGIENMNPEEFLEKTNILLEKKDDLEALTRKYIKSSSFTKARYDATMEILDDENFISSNNILALEYIRAIDRINSKIKPIPIRRLSSENADLYLREGKISSSTAIRNNIHKDYKDHVPRYSYQSIEDSKKSFGIASMDYEYGIFSYLLLLEKRPMDEIIGFEEGIDNYLSKIVKENHDSFLKFLNQAITKRYTSARIRRLMLNYILDNKSYFNSYDINFYKVLTFRENASFIFRNSKARAVLTKADYDKLSLNDKTIFDHIIDASNLYSMGQKRELFRDFSKKIGRY